MNKFIAILAASITIFVTSCSTIATKESSGTSKEDLLEQNDIYVPWWAQEEAN